MKKEKIIIIGGGILGISHAFHACRSGMEVVLIEKDPRPMGASVLNFGQIVPSGFGSKWQKYGRSSLLYYQEIQDVMDITIRKEGSLYVASDEEELILLEELAQINQSNDYPSQLFSQRQCLERIPSLKKDYVLGGLFFPDELVIDPRIGVSRISDYLVHKYGMTYYPQTVATGIEPTSYGVKVYLEGARILEASSVVLCCGSTFDILFPDVFRNSDIQLVTLQMMQTVPQDRTKIPGSLLTGTTIRRYEAFQECPSYQRLKSGAEEQSMYSIHSIHILAKQNLDGSIVLGDSHHYQPLSKGRSFSSDTLMAVNEFMIQEAQHILNIPSWTMQRSWIGQYAQCSQDIYNKSLAPGIQITTAIGGKGMTASLGYAKENLEKIFHA